MKVKSRRNYEKKKKKAAEKAYNELVFLIFFPLICYFCWFVFNIFVTDFYILLGVIVANISSICLFGFILYLVLSSKELYGSIKEKRIKDFFISLLTIVVLVIALGVRSFELMNGIKDSIIGSKEIVIQDYEVIKRSRRKGPRIYKITGYDTEGNEYELQSRHYISEYENSIKIIYYENLKMIKSFEYN